MQKRSCDPKALPILDRTREQFLCPKNLHFELVVSEENFELGEFFLNPRPLNALTSNGVILLFYESSPRKEEEIITETIEPFDIMCALAKLEHKRKHRTSKSSDAGETYNGPPKKNMRSCQRR